MKKSFVIVFLIVSTVSGFAQSTATPAPTASPHITSIPTATPTPGPTEINTQYPTNVPDTNPPTTPQNLRVNGAVERMVYLEWDPSTDDTGIAYYIINVTDSDGTFNTQAYENPITLVMEAETTYSFKVLAVDTSGNTSGWSNTVVAVTGVPEPPTVPQNLVVLDTTATTITLSWDPSTDPVGISGYLIKYTGSDGSTNLWATFPIPTTVMNLNPDTTYTLIVQASDMGGSTSDWSEPVTGTTLAAPAGWTPYPTPTGGPIITPQASADPNSTPGPTGVPATTPSTGCTCPNLCSSMTNITIPFTKDGSGEYCYLSPYLGSYVNSWNCDVVNVNGVICTNIYTSSSTIDMINGYYYIYFKASYPYSHMEIK